MFGIAKPCRHRLTPELREQYRAHLCGLCTSLRDGHGQAARAVTNVDAVLLSVMVEAQREAPLGRRDVGPCPLRAMQPASVITPAEGAMAHSAGMSLAAAAMKIRDHALDGDGAVGRVPATAVRLSRRWERDGRADGRRAGFDLSVLDDAVVVSEARERDRTLSFVDWSGPTEDVVAAAFAHTAVLAGVDENHALLDRIGRMFARITYLVDAVEDEADDIAAGRFNPLVTEFPDPAERLAAAQQLFEAAFASLVAAFDQLTLVRPDLARHLLVDQLGRRARSALGLGGASSCSVGANRGARHRGHGPMGAFVTVSAGVGAWALASLPLFGRRRRQQKQQEPPDCDCCCDCCCEGDCCDCCGDCDCGCDC